MDEPNKKPRTWRGFEDPDGEFERRDRKNTFQMAVGVAVLIIIGVIVRYWLGGPRDEFGEYSPAPRTLPAAIHDAALDIGGAIIGIALVVAVLAAWSWIKRKQKPK